MPWGLPGSLVNHGDVRHVRTCVGAAPDGDADALAGMLLAVMSLERSTAAQPSWLDEARFFSGKDIPTLRSKVRAFMFAVWGLFARVITLSCGGPQTVSTQHFVNQPPSNGVPMKPSGMGSSRYNC